MSNDKPPRSSVPPRAMQDSMHDAIEGPPSKDRETLEPCAACSGCRLCGGARMTTPMRNARWRTTRRSIPMRDSVRAAFVTFTAAFEGVATWLYCDVRGLVTTAIGVLADPSSVACDMPFIRPDGTPATRLEIAREWTTVKGRADLRLAGGGAYKAITKLRLSDDGVQHVVQDKLATMERVLKGRFPAWDDFGCDAQLGLLSVAWAAGPAFNMPRFADAVERQDWTTCVLESHLDDTHNPGLTPRNAANAKLFSNAARVSNFGMDPDVLWYPGEPEPAASENAPATPTQGPSA